MFVVAGFGASTGGFELRAEGESRSVGLTIFSAPY